MKIKIAFASFILMLGSAFNVNSALVSADWLIAGDNLVTRDDSGLEWLDLSQTIGLSYQEVLGQTGAGGSFDGWRFANPTELHGLWTSAGGDPSTLYRGYSTENNGIFDVLAPFWGDTYCMNQGCAPGEGFASTLFWDPYGVTLVYVSLVWDRFDDPDSLTQDWFKTFHASKTIFDTIDNTASALVRNSVIPIPATIWLFGTALIGLIGFSKRRKLS